MKAARLFGKRDVRVQEVPEPEAINVDEVVVRPRLSGICGTDMSEYRHGPTLVGATPHPLTGGVLPQIVGHEFSAEVVRVGSAVTTMEAGQRVSVMPLLACGQCSACRHGRHQSCVTLAAVGINTRWGGMAELAVVNAAQVTVLPDDFSDAQGALIEPAAVAVNSVSGAGVSPGDTVLVTGAGPIGQLAGLAAFAAGATAVYVLEPHAGRRRRAEAVGFTAVLDPADGGVDQVLEAIPDGVDAAIECAGVDVALAGCLEAVRSGGTIVQTALHHRAVTLDVRRITDRDITLIGRTAYPFASWPRMIRLLGSGALPAERVVTRQLALADIVDEGFEALLDPQGDDVKVLVEIS